MNRKMNMTVTVANDLACLWRKAACRIENFGAPGPGTFRAIRKTEQALQELGVTPMRHPGLVAAARALYDEFKPMRDQWGNLQMDNDDWFEHRKMSAVVNGLASCYEVEAVEVPDLQPGQYVVTIKDDNGRIGYLLGPYAEHQVAIDNKPRARRLASAADPWSDFYAIGTVRFAPDAKKLPPTVFGK